MTLWRRACARLRAGGRTVSRRLRIATRDTFWQEIANCLPCQRVRMKRILSFLAAGIVLSAGGAHLETFLRPSSPLNQSQQEVVLVRPPIGTLAAVSMR